MVAPPRFTHFMNSLKGFSGTLADHGTPGNRYCFTMDNLDAHANNAVQALVLNAGLRVVFRTPYPAGCTVEYVFNVNVFYDLGCMRFDSHAKYHHEYY